MKVARTVWSGGKLGDYFKELPITIYLCPQNQILKYTMTTREGYREYKSNSTICAAWPCLSQRTLSKNQTKVVIRHIWLNYVEKAGHLRHTPKIRETYKNVRKPLKGFLSTLRRCLHKRLSKV